MADAAMNTMGEVPKIDFPCAYPIKVIAAMGPNLTKEIVAIIKKYDSRISPHKVELHPSKKGNYLSIRYQFWATGTGQLQQMFDDLKKHSLVRMVL